MPNYAKITLIGHVGHDPRTPIKDKPEFITFSLAVTDKWKDKNSGERVSRTDWYDCNTSQTGLAGVIREYVKKGDAVYIEGRPKYSIYQTKDSGESKVKVEVNIDKLEMLGGKQDSNETSNPTNMNGKYSPQKGTIAASDGDDPFRDDEIPF